jgi:hypothetical protein
MAISFDDIETAFTFVSMDQQYIHNAYLYKTTGEMYFTSEFGDSDELPDDIDDPEKYISIPHQNDLDLGRNLVFVFVSEYRPEQLGMVHAIFRNKGAYSRYKAFLVEEELLEQWYQYEQKHQKAALLKWCKENGIEIKE